MNFLSSICAFPVLEIDIFMKSVLEDITEAAQETIPRTKPKVNNEKQKKLAGWKEYVELNSGSPFGKVQVNP